MLPISLSRLCLSLRSLFQHHQPAQQVTTETTTVRGSQGSGSPPLSLSVSSIASPASSTTMYSRKPKSPFDPPPPTQHQQAPYRLSISGASPLHHRTSSPVIFLNLRQNQPLTLSQIYQNLMNLRINDPNVAFQCHELPLVERFDAEGSSEKVDDDEEGPTTKKPDDDEEGRPGRRTAMRTKNGDDVEGQPVSTSEVSKQLALKVAQF
ncbi:hypothetical protein RHMOL_Rhmol04G0233200 [Rhododendron molle]|uniref:Uncharacterized protein n=1 Tax=Rhododendron molle TaxID=49168 RepID=A0ACC0P4S8_RHOML|nr:hypothetical protein RHMOL_Rhmol04G0233200 [Rhododendron molle]